MSNNSSDAHVTFQLDSTEVELQRCLDSLHYVLKYKGPDEAARIVRQVVDYARQSGVSTPIDLTTPYVNTISADRTPPYPGDTEIEERIQNVMRWNAMAMVVKANREHDGLGGHISTYASCSTLYEVGFNHFFRGNGTGRNADQIYFQGHASPGNYARSYLEGRLTAQHLHNFRQDFAKGGGLTSYPHPDIMPDYWQFPTVSMGLGPIMSIYQARFNRYMTARDILKEDHSHVWCFIGDGETEEPETLGAIQVAARDKLDNLIFVINCNLQRLDGPVRGNGKIIQDLESVFRGAGWNVIKVIWGSNWDPLLKSPYKSLLIKRMDEVVDGEYQKYTVEPGSYMRKHFFGKYPELLELVNDKTDEQLKGLLRGGHDPSKVYAAYKAALEHKGSPTVILAKTVKGYGLGEAGEGKNISHQQKKLNEKELREYRGRLNIPVSDEDVVEAPFYSLPDKSKEKKYLLKCREELGGFLPERKTDAPPLVVPNNGFFKEFLKSSGEGDLSTTMAFVRILSKLIRDKEIGPHIVPIVPDESRTFGMESLFRQIGIYSTKGQLYEPVDSASLLYYREAKDGQMIEEGITEAGCMASFLAAGTSYSTHGINMIPFFIYYSMFGFQRIGDMMWLAGDIHAKGFLLGGTAGRTTLNGEGLQHQDGHSHILASTIPAVVPYDPSYRFEIAIILQEGLRRMYAENEHVFYYLTLGNENYVMPEMPKGVEEGILKGLYKFKPGIDKAGYKKAHIFGSGAITKEAVSAQAILEERYKISADIWSATSYKLLREDAIQTQRLNMLNPKAEKKKSYVETLLAKEEGPFIAVSDNMRLVPDQIAPWVPGGLFTLGTDGFGRSDTRETLRRYFEVDKEFIVLAVLYSLSEKGIIDPSVPEQAIRDLGIDKNKPYPSRI